MFESSEPGASASSVPPTDSASTQSTDYDEVKHLLYGTTHSINSTIHFLHKRGYAEPNDWCELMPTGRPNEWMTLLTKRVPLE